MAGIAAKTGGDEKRALFHFTSLSRMHHPLKNWAKLQRATLLANQSSGKAISVLKQLAKKDWTGQGESQALLHSLKEKSGLRAHSVKVEQSSKSTARGEEPASLDLQYEEAQALYRKGKFAEAESAFERLVPRLSGDSGRLCEARLMQGRSISRQRQYARAASFMSSVADECSSAEVKAPARYHAAKGYTRKREYEKAIAQYDALVREAAQSNLADDALFLSALLSQELGDTESMLHRFKTLTRQYPTGDMRGEARYRIASHYLANDAPKDALEEIQVLLSEDLQEHDDGIQGRALYWKARTLAKLGRQAEAKAAYADVVKRYPLRYYAILAAGRYQTSDDKGVRALLREAWGKGPKEKRERLRFSWRTELKSPVFSVALEFLHVGDGKRAVAEFASLGLLKDEQPLGGRWLCATLLHAAGQLPEASRIMRRSKGYRDEPPKAQRYRVWTIAYPKAYKKLVKKYAEQQKLASSFVYAVAREESAFDPSAVSSANAFGLLQIILPTARSLAKPIGMSVSPTALKRPSVNIRLGTSYMEELRTRYSGQMTIVPAAYNAGPGAADRWIKAKPDQPFDMWVESIPYEETRRYTRRVLQSYGVYSWLYQGKLLDIPDALPHVGS